MRVLKEAEKVRANYETAATINLSILKLAEKRKFQIVNATDLGDGLGHALGQAFESSSGKQFHLIQHTQKPKPSDTYTKIMMARGTSLEMSENLGVVLNDLGLTRKHIDSIRPTLILLGL